MTIFCQAHQERRMDSSGLFEETIHKSKWADLLPSTFSYSQYQLLISKVIEKELAYTPSITEVGSVTSCDG